MTKSKLDFTRPSLEIYTHLPTGFDLFGEELCQSVWASKYKFSNEQNMADTARRVVTGVYAQDTDKEQAIAARQAIALGLWMPGGRILAGAGTEKRVTLFNCYLNATLEDSMEGIHRGFGDVMLTMQQGGGIGTDFTPLRPDGAWLSRTQAPASGPIPFIIAQDSIGQCVESAGERRGAQMGTLADFHPDLLKFISIKNKAGVLTQFNLSILISDAFMAAVAEDEDWLLYHAVPPRKRAPELEALDFFDDYTGLKAYVYSKHRARDLWEMITRHTYEYSEPGIIFIDRVNELNNLWYREQIRCTNPCGEQPLPPDACCNLGALNLALMVKNPFTDEAEFDYELLRRTVFIGQRFLDNVTDVTNYPLDKQRIEQEQTRRTGLGYSGLASAMALLGIRYGSTRAARFTTEVTRATAIATYQASALLAEERGAFPAYDENAFWNNDHSFAAKRFRGQSFYGRPLRNGVSNTLAPTGTTSIAFGNIDSSLEPIWLLEYDRNVRQPDDTYKASRTQSFTKRLWTHLNGEEAMPKHVVTANQLEVHEHVVIQEAAQEWIDSSISKTINVPKDMPYERFASVYDMAYEAGLKGCTTYRESDVRGSILVSAASSAPDAEEAKPGIVMGDLASIKRPDILQGQTAKVSWPAMNSAAYVTLSRLEDGQPFEMFLSSKDQRNNEWMTTATLFISWLMRLGVPLKKIAEEMMQVHSLDGYIVAGRYRPSFVSYIGNKLLDLDEHFLTNQANQASNPGSQPPPPAEAPTESVAGQEMNMPGMKFARGKRCPQCNSFRIVAEQGCEKCIDCGHSKCT
jgi:ribonucleoside-diphosphate reductase alpha chain